MDPKLGMYLGYLVITIGMTVWVARTLFHNGQLFLRAAFANDEVATAVNRLLQAGFYLINLGFVALFMRTSQQVGTAAEAFEATAMKLGWILPALGAMHLLNIFVLSRFRRHFQAEKAAERVAETVTAPHQRPRLVAN